MLLIWVYSFIHANHNKWAFVLYLELCDTQYWDLNINSWDEKNHQTDKLLIVFTKDCLD